MKKILLFTYVLMVCSVLVTAQSLTLSNTDGPIANGGMVMVSGDMNFPIVATVSVTNTTGSTMDVMCRKSYIEIVPGTYNYFCWGLCYPPDQFVSVESVAIAGNSTNNTDFSGDYDAAGIMGISKIMYTFYNQNVPDDSVAFEVWFNAGIVGKDELLPGGIRFSKPYPNPARGMVHFDYSLPAGFDGVPQLRIVNLPGAVVKETGLENTSGRLSLDISDLNEGIYFYSLLAGDRVIVSRKMVVK